MLDLDVGEQLGKLLVLDPGEDAGARGILGHQVTDLDLDLLGLGWLGCRRLNLYLGLGGLDFLLGHGGWHGLWRARGERGCSGDPCEPQERTT